MKIMLHKQRILLRVYVYDVLRFRKTEDAPLFGVVKTIVCELNILVLAFSRLPTSA